MTANIDIPITLMMKDQPSSPTSALSKGKHQLHTQLSSKQIHV